MKSALALLFAVLFAAPAWSGELDVTLRTTGGQPVSEAVVTVYPASGLPDGPIRFDWPYRMAQKNIQFSPFVLIVPVGASVPFPNMDPVRHHVYSFSPAHKFELKLYGKDDKEVVKFDKPGAVALGCNIHDQMVGFIKVVDTPFANKSEASGEVHLRGLPAGKATVRIWHPYLKAPGNEIVRTVVVLPQGVTRDAASLDVRPPPMRHAKY